MTAPLRFDAAYYRRHYQARACVHSAAEVGRLASGVVGLAGWLGVELKAALDALVEQPGIGTSVENARNRDVRRLYLTRVRYFVYYRVQGPYLDVVAFWHESREEGPRV